MNGAKARKTCRSHYHAENTETQYCLQRSASTQPRKFLGNRGQNGRATGHVEVRGARRVSTLRSARSRTSSGIYMRTAMLLSRSFNFFKQRAHAPRAGQQNRMENAETHPICGELSVPAASQQDSLSNVWKKSQFSSLAINSPQTRCRAPSSDSKG